jgi:hypothetical protein
MFLLLPSFVLGGAMAFGACAATGDNPNNNGGGSNVGGNQFDAGEGGGLTTMSACASASDQAKLIPVNIYIMFDKSASMGGIKWSQSTAALQAFFMDPASGGLRVALRFFPDTGCDTTCNAAACAQPKVSIGELTNLSAPTDTHEDSLVNAFVGVVPSGGTPLSAALDGAITWGRNFLDAAPLEKAVVVLVTDGDPSDCQLSQSYFATAAQNAFVDHGILTFAIGLEGSNETLMNAIASAGGTTGGYFIGSADVQEHLVDALNDIRESFIACEYQVPESVDGDAVDPNKVNVLYTPQGASAPITIGQVVSKDACSGATGGWYYDDPINPTTITFCAATCSALQADLGGKLELLFGCSTIPA